MNAIAPTSPRHRATLRAQPQTSLASAVATIAAVTIAAATLAWLLSGIVHLSQNAVVITVMVVAFVASWITTNPRPVSNHRVTVIRVSARAH
jgi:hypothetical protein